MKKGSFLRSVVGLVLICFLPLVILVPVLNKFPFPPGNGAYSDLAITHLPNALFLLRSIRQWGTLPFWSPSILSGYPFWANPLSGIWYPPGWVAYLFPLPFGFTLLVILHLIWGGLGTYLFMRRANVHPVASLFAAIGVAGMPKLYAHYGAGHLSLLYAIPWTPWVLLFVGREAIYSSVQRRPGWIDSMLAFLKNVNVLLVCSFLMILLSDLRWAFYACVLWFLYTVYVNRHVHENRPGLLAINFFLPLLFSVLIASPFLFPFSEYTRLSTRVFLNLKDIFSDSLPLSHLLGLLVPDYGGFYEWLVYPGGVFILLWIFSVLWHPHRKEVNFWFAIGLLGLIIALGNNLPFNQFWGRLPGISLLRVPARALFLSDFAIVFGAAYCVDILISGLYSPEQKGLLRFVLVIGSFSLFINIGIVILTHRYLFNFLYSFVIICLVTFLTYGLYRSKINRTLGICLLIAICIFDLWLIDRSLITVRENKQVMSEGENVVQFLLKQKGIFRIFSPSYSIPQQTAANSGFELADGIDPLQYQSYVNFMNNATGIHKIGYSVTLPPYKSGSPATDNADSKPDPSLLGLLNIRYIVSEYDIHADNLQYITRYGNTRIYQNLKELPRAWIQPVNATIGEMATPVTSIISSPNKIDIQANCAADGVGCLLILAEINYSGWQAEVDGNKQAVVTVDSILRSVALSKGIHRITFEFFPNGVIAGLVLCIAAILCLFVSRMYFRV